MKVIKVMLVVIPLAFGATAQDTLATKRYAGIYVDLGVGCLCGIPMENVNRILFFNGLPSLPQSMVASHIGPGVWYKRLSVATLFKSYTQGSSGNSAYGMQGGGQGVEIKFQYDILNSGDFRVAPYAGAGTQQFDFAFDGTSARDLNTALQSASSPADSRRINTAERFLSGGLSVGLSKFLSKVGYGFGLQFGYQYVTSGQWRLNDELIQTPSSNFSGLDIKLTFKFMFDITPKGRSNNPPR